MKKNIFILILLLGNISCQHQKMYSEFFRDIDLLSLRGKGELSKAGASFPYVRIDSIDQATKRVTYFLSEQKSMHQIYEQHENGWLSHSTFNGTDTIHHYFELIKPNESITYLKYGAANPFESDSAYLISVAQYTADEKVAYIFGGITDIRAKPSNDLTSFPIDNFYIKVAEHFDISDGLLKVSEKRTFSQTGDSHMDVRCFDLGQSSIFWYLECFFLMEKVDCSR